ncbi:MAG: ABC-type transporter, periplasmic subunit [Gemmatimonadetes bacterium]|nr:ABC-type transporter, periplasmic subunit [Gemmatimonadota bacterium]
MATGARIHRSFAAGHLLRGDRCPFLHPVLRSFRHVVRLHASLALIVFSACGESHRAAPAPHVDDFGDTIRSGTPAAPSRIASLNPATTELLFALGAGPRVVARTTWDVWPDAARAVPDVGPGLRPNVEAVLARHPDLVVLYASAENRVAAQQLRAAGVAVIALRINRLADFARASRELGRAVGESASAATVIDTMQRTLARVRAATLHLDHPTVFWHVWDSPIYTIGTGSFLDELLTIAGGTNIYSDRSEPSPQVSLEDITRRDPRIILAGVSGKTAITTSPLWQGVRAVREGRVFVVDTNLVGRPSVRAGEAAAAIARLLHPGLAL